jgi:hypothetical protein
VVRTRGQPRLPPELEELSRELARRSAEYGSFISRQARQEADLEARLRTLKGNHAAERDYAKGLLLGEYRTACRKLLPRALHRMKALHAERAFLREDRRDEIIASDQGNGDTYSLRDSYYLLPGRRVAHYSQGAWHSGGDGTTSTIARMPFSAFLAGLAYPATVIEAYESLRRIATARSQRELGA